MMDQVEKKALWALVALLFTLLALVGGLVFFVSHSNGQTPAAPAAAAKAGPSPERIPITDNLETLTVQNLSLKEQLLQKQYTEFQNAWKDFESQRSAVEAERKKVEAQLLKAHALDPSQYRLDEQSAALVKTGSAPRPAAPQAPAHH